MIALSSVAALVILGLSRQYINEDAVVNEIHRELWPRPIQGQAEIDFSTINDPNGGGIVNNGSTVHLKKTVVDGVLYNDQYYS